MKGLCVPIIDHLFLHWPLASFSNRLFSLYIYALQVSVPTFIADGAGGRHVAGRGLGPGGRPVPHWMAGRLRGGGTTPVQHPTARSSSKVGHFSKLDFHKNATS